MADLDLNDIQELASLGESEELEYKESTGQRSDASKTLTAMANGRGGKVLFGVSPNGEIVGQQVSERTLEKVAQELGHIDPPIPTSMSTVSLGENGREVLVVSVRPGSDPPYTYRDTLYERVGATTSARPRSTLRTRIVEAAHSSDRWETQELNWTVDDLDLDQVAKALSRAASAGRLSESGAETPEDTLRKFHVIRDGRLLRAAAVLFGEPQRLESELPQCHLKLGRFRGTTRSEYDESDQLHGNVFELLEAALNFFNRHVPTRGRVSGDSVEREERPLYPLVAIREALLNAFAHRDYAVPGGTSMAIFDDRLEIRSVGGLHFGLTPERLMTEHESQPWNPLIAGVLYRVGLIEQWGSGIDRMVESTREAGVPPPDIEEIANGLAVRFRQEPALDEDIPPVQREILDLLRENEELALRHIVAAISSEVSKRAVRDHLAALKEMELVITQGHGRGATWTLAKDE